MFLRLTTIVVFLLAAAELTAGARHGNYLYQVSTVRAAPAMLAELLTWIDAVAATEYYDDAGMARPFVMHHSQGDQWDLMLITPMESFTAHYREPAIVRREKTARSHAALLARAEAMIAVDVFTIGFHESFASFATPSPATDAEKETAARAAGFRGRDDISFYLRKLISAHHDTLAVEVD